MIVAVSPFSWNGNGISRCAVSNGCFQNLIRAKLWCSVHSVSYRWRSWMWISHETWFAAGSRYSYIIATVSTLFTKVVRDIISAIYGRSSWHSWLMPIRAKPSPVKIERISSESKRWFPALILRVITRKRKKLIDSLDFDARNSIRRFSTPRNVSSVKSSFRPIQLALVSIHFVPVLPQFWFKSPFSIFVSSLSSFSLLIFIPISMQHFCSMVIVEAHY